MNYNLSVLTKESLIDAQPLVDQARQCEGMNIRALGPDPSGNTFFLSSCGTPIALFSVKRKNEYWVKFSDTLTNMQTVHQNLYDFGSWYVSPEHRHKGVLLEIFLRSIEIVNQSVDGEAYSVVGIRSMNTEFPSIHPDAFPSMSFVINHGYRLLGIDPADGGLRFIRRIK